MIHLPKFDFLLLLAMVAIWCFASGCAYSDWQRRRESLKPRRSLESRLHRDAQAFKQAMETQPSEFCPVPFGIDLTYEDMRQAMEDLRK